MTSDLTIFIVEHRAPDSPSGTPVVGSRKGGHRLAALNREWHGVVGVIMWMLSRQEWVFWLAWDAARE